MNFNCTFCHCYATPFLFWMKMKNMALYYNISLLFIIFFFYEEGTHRTMAKPLPNSLRSGDAAAISASFLLVKILFVFVGTGEHTDARHFFPNYHFWHKNATTCKKYKNIFHFSTKKILLLVLLLIHILVELWSLVLLMKRISKEHNYTTKSNLLMCTWHCKVLLNSNCSNWSCLLLQFVYSFTMLETLPFLFSSNHLRPFVLRVVSLKLGHTGNYSIYHY